MNCLGIFLLLLSFVSILVPLRAELAVTTGFEGGSAIVDRIAPASRVIEVRPGGDPARPRLALWWSQISGQWVNDHGNPGTLAACLQTAGNTTFSTTESYRSVGAR